MLTQPWVSWEDPSFNLQHAWVQYQLVAWLRLGAAGVGGDASCDAGGWPWCSGRPPCILLPDLGQQFAWVQQLLVGKLDCCAGGPPGLFCYRSPPVREAACLRPWRRIWAASRKDRSRQHRALHGNLKVVMVNITALSNLRLALAGGPTLPWCRKSGPPSRSCLLRRRPLAT